MPTARICVCHPETGAVLLALDGHHGEAHAAAWALDSAEAVRAELGIEPVVVEYSPAAGADHCRENHYNIHEMRLDLHRRPDGRVEVAGLGRKAVACATSVRVLSAPPEFERAPRGIHNRGRELATLAHEWRTALDAPYRRRMSRVSQ